MYPELNCLDLTSDTLEALVLFLDATILDKCT